MDRSLCCNTDCAGSGKTTELQALHGGLTQHAKLLHGIYTVV